MPSPLLSTRCGQVLISSFNQLSATVAGLEGPTYCAALRFQAHLVLGRMKSSTRSLPSETTRSGSRARMGKSVRDDGALLPSFPWGPDQRAPFSLQRYIFGHKIGC